MSIEHVMMRLGRIISADSNLIVEVRGSQAFATPGRIVLPSIEEFETLGPAQAERLMHGLVDHETGHALDTDFQVYEEAAKIHPSFKRLLNAIEDGYIEKRQCARFVGSRHNLTLKNGWFWHDGAGSMPAKAIVADDSKPMWERFCLAVTMHVRPDGISLKEIDDASAEVGRMVRDVASELAKVDKLLDRSKQTRAVMEIASEVWRVHHDDTKPDPESDPTATAYTPEQALCELVERSMLPNQFNNKPYVVFDPSFDLERDLSKMMTEDARLSYEHLRKDAEATTNDLVFAFESGLRDRQRRRMQVSQDESGVIDVESLVGFSLGVVDPGDIWIDYQGEEPEGKATVAVLIDCSGSMAGHKALLARQCAIAIHEALRRCQIPHELTGFTTTYSSYPAFTHPWIDTRSLEYNAHFQQLRALCVEAHSKGTDLSKFARTCPKADPSGENLQVPIYGIFKGFDSKDARPLALVSGIANNLDGEAVLWQARRLAHRSERRKVMFVLSDGYPAGANDDASGCQYLKTAVQRTLAAGIEVYGIGILSAAVEEFYPHWWVCHKLADLPAVAMSALTETLVGRDAHGRTELG